MKSYNDYFYPGTAVLQNKLGIQDADDLARTEALSTQARMRQSTGAMEFTPDGLRAIHRHIFQGPMAWWTGV